MIAIMIIDISQMNTEGLIRDAGKEEAMRLVKQVIENNVMLLKLQKQLLESQVAENQKKRREQEKNGGERNMRKDGEKKNRKEKRKKRRRGWIMSGEE